MILDIVSTISYLLVDVGFDIIYRIYTYTHIHHILSKLVFVFVGCVFEFVTLNNFYFGVFYDPLLVTIVLYSSGKLCRPVFFFPGSGDSNKSTFFEPIPAARDLIKFDDT